ncbi:putative hydroxyethylthiazole kinase [Helianthus annuus]|nr:putative hydroxyethylthiazole kinase [Helianthus annuus]KAJ0601067.1 putative hydroxyethylthiazole kinase [Helianthus annuus]KAJ0608253.1 putative hydroxyethylthiazole kinase [Helianthus annuus]
MDIMSNTLLAAGSSLAMAHSILEIPNFTPNTQAVVINVGTLTHDWLSAMKVAPVWLISWPTIVRGNGSEIIALSMASLGSTKMWCGMVVVTGGFMVAWWW